MTPYLVPTPPAPSEHPSFAMADAAYAELRSALTGEAFAHVDHAAAEEAIEARGREILRRLFEGWANTRVRGEPTRDVTGADGVERTHHREATRAVESVFGTASVARDRVGARGSSALVPGDALLNLCDDRFTFGVRRRVAEEAARGAFETAARAVASSTGADVAKRQAEDLALAASVDFDAFYAQASRGDAIRPPDGHLLVLTVDGKGIVMRPEGLRPATRDAAAKAAPKLKKRLSKGEKRNRKRMATVAAVYTIEPQPRTADDIVGDLDRKDAKPRPRAARKRVFASVRKPARSVIDEMFDEATRRDPEHRHRWVALVDGSLPQMREVRAAANARNTDVTLVLDIIHAIEYLWAASWELHAEGDPAAEAWVGKHLRMLLAGRASHVAAAIRRSATARRLEKRTSIDTAAGYFLKNKALMRYDLYLKDGLPIATGVIEGACRHLVKDRMDITGARWGLDGAEAVLRLRSLMASGDLERYWAFHRSREFERNHRSRHAESEDAWLSRIAA